MKSVPSDFIEDPLDFHRTLKSNQLTRIAIFQIHFKSPDRVIPFGSNGLRQTFQMAGQTILILRFLR